MITYTFKQIEASNGPGRLHAFGLNSDGKVLLNWRDKEALWTGWMESWGSDGHKVEQDPSVVFDFIHVTPPGTTLRVFALRNNGRVHSIYQDAQHDYEWKNWQSWNSGLPDDAPLAQITSGFGNGEGESLHLFALTRAGLPFMRYFDKGSGKWADWRYWGQDENQKKLRFHQLVASHGKNNLHVFGIIKDESHGYGSIYVKHRAESGKWTDWYQPWENDALFSQLALISGEENLHLFGLGVTKQFATHYTPLNTVYLNWRNGDKWWTKMKRWDTEPKFSAPSLRNIAVRQGAGNPHVFGVGGRFGNTIYMRSRRSESEGSSWRDWEKNPFMKYDYEVQASPSRDYKGDLPTNVDGDDIYGGDYPIAIGQVNGQLFVFCNAYETQRSGPAIVHQDSEFNWTYWEKYWGVDDLLRGQRSLIPKKWRINRSHGSSIPTDTNLAAEQIRTEEAKAMRFWSEKLPYSNFMQRESPGSIEITYNVSLPQLRQIDPNVGNNTIGGHKDGKVYILDDPPSSWYAGRLAYTLAHEIGHNLLPKSGFGDAGGHSSDPTALMYYSTDDWKWPPTLSVEAKDFIYQKYGNENSTVKAWSLFHESDYNVSHKNYPPRFVGCWTDKFKKPVPLESTYALSLRDVNGKPELVIYSFIDSDEASGPKFVARTYRGVREGIDRWSWKPFTWDVNWGSHTLSSGTSTEHQVSSFQTIHGLIHNFTFGLLVFAGQLWGVRISAISATPIGHLQPSSPLEITAVDSSGAPNLNTDDFLNRIILGVWKNYALLLNQNGQPQLEVVQIDITNDPNDFTISVLSDPIVPEGMTASQLLQNYQVNQLFGFHESVIYGLKFFGVHNRRGTPGIRLFNLNINDDETAFTATLDDSDTQGDSFTDKSLLGINRFMGNIHDQNLYILGFQ